MKGSEKLESFLTQLERDILSIVCDTETPKKEREKLLIEETFTNLKKK